MIRNLKKCLVMSPVLFLLLAGSALAKAEAKPKYSGFLSDYSQLKLESEGSKALKYVNPQADMKKYKKFIVERIIVWLKSDAEYKGIDPEAMKALTDYFREAIVRELGSDYLLVTEPGPDVLRLRIAITDLSPTKTGVSLIVLATPFASVPDIVSGAVSKGGVGSPPYLGHAAIEVEGIDSETLRQVFAYVEQRFGKKYDAENPGGYINAYKEWGYVKGAFDYWAKKFRTRLDVIHGKKVEEKK